MHLFMLTALQDINSQPVNDYLDAHPVIIIVAMLIGLALFVMEYWDRWRKK